RFQRTADCQVEDLAVVALVVQQRLQAPVIEKQDPPPFSKPLGQGPPFQERMHHTVGIFAPSGRGPVLQLHQAQPILVAPVLRLSFKLMDPVPNTHGSTSIHSLVGQPSRLELATAATRRPTVPVGAGHRSHNRDGWPTIHRIHNYSNPSKARVVSPKA